MNDTPKWPEKMKHNEWGSIRDHSFVNGYNSARAACIAAFEEWQKGRVELEELDKEKLRKILDEFSDSENCVCDFWREGDTSEKIASLIVRRLGVRRELEELDEDGLYGFLLSLSGDLRFAYIYKGQEGGDPARDVAKAICQRFGVRKNKACPCKHTEPCQDDCTCVNALSSKGCLRCCTYGNKEQQLKTAQRLVAFIDRPKVPTVEDIRKTMIRAEHGDAAFTTTKRHMDVLNKQAEAIHKLITGGDHD